jgi:hypothetical protein
MCYRGSSYSFGSTLVQSAGPSWNVSLHYLEIPPRKLLRYFYFGMLMNVSPHPPSIHGPQLPA